MIFPALTISAASERKVCPSVQSGEFISAAFEHTVRTSVQYRLPAFAISADSERTVRTYIFSVQRVHARMWQYNGNRGTCCFKRSKV